MFAAVYRSEARPPLSRASLERLLEQCRTRNTETGVTGLLLYQDAEIIQFLEGEEGVVRGLLARIGEDARHHEMTVLWSAEQDARSFPDWSMGFRDLDDDPVDLEGYSDVMSRPVSLGEVLRQPTTGQELLGMFRRLH